jgi:hypothetical protein
MLRVSVVQTFARPTRIDCLSLRNPVCSGLGLGSCILHLICYNPISRCCSLLVWRIGIWGDGFGTAFGGFR